MTDVRDGRLERPHFLGIDDDGRAMFAPGPGVRDLGDTQFCDLSLERSLRRRRAAQARRPGLPQSAAVRLSAALMAASVVGSQAGGVAQAATTTTHDATSLQLGSHGAAVKALQRALGIGADGVFGHVTRKAVRSYQRAHGLAVDGVVGPRTRAALGMGAGAHARTTSDSSDGDGAAGDASAADVPSATATAIQRKLGIAADGVFGPQSRKALRAYQRAHGLTVDGVPGPQTLASMGIDGSATTTTTADGDGSSSASATSSAGAGTSAAVSAARTKLGSAYASGAEGPSSFDCSGLTQWAFRQAGVSLPRTSFAQYGVGTSIDHGSVQAGDLVFFSTDGPGASHVGIATGPSSAISATSHGVMEHSTTSGYWGAHYLGARRVS